MATLWAKTVTFESVNLGDRLPIVIKWETRESIERFNAQVGFDAADADAEPSLAPAAVLSYVKELLVKAFPPASITAPGSTLEMDLSTPVMANDTISLSGTVVAKRGEGATGLVECQILIENDRQQAVGQAVAVVAL